MSISFSEVLVIVLVALLVIKPENLPDTAFKLGKWLKWLRQTTANIKNEIEGPLEKLTHDKPTEENE